MLLTGIPHESTRSSECPCLGVGSVIDCTRLKESITLQKSLTTGIVWQQTWIIKSLTMTTLSYLGISPARRSVKSLKKSLLYLGGR